MVNRHALFSCEICGKVYKDANDAHDCEEQCRNKGVITIVWDRRNPKELDIKVESLDNMAHAEALKTLKQAIETLGAHMKIENKKKVRRNAHLSKTKKTKTETAEMTDSSKPSTPISEREARMQRIKEKKERRSKKRPK